MPIKGLILSLEIEVGIDFRFYFRFGQNTNLDKGKLLQNGKLTTNSTKKYIFQFSIEKQNFYSVMFSIISKINLIDDV